MTEPLRCGVPGCNATIRGVTGFQEAQNLLAHLNKKHAEPGTCYTLTDALEFRVRFEEAADAAR